MPQIRGRLSSVPVSSSCLLGFASLNRPRWSSGLFSSHFTSFQGPWIRSEHAVAPEYCLCALSQARQLQAPRCRYPTEPTWKTCKGKWLGDNLLVPARYVFFLPFIRCRWLYLECLWWFGLNDGGLHVHRKKLFDVWEGWYVISFLHCLFLAKQYAGAQQRMQEIYSRLKDVTDLPG